MSETKTRTTEAERRPSKNGLETDVETKNGLNK